MRAVIVVLGLTVALVSGAAAQNPSSKFTAPDAKSKLDRAGGNAAQFLELKARAPALKRDVDATVDLETLKAVKPEANAKFTAASKMSAKTGPALAAAKSVGDGESTKLAPPAASKAVMSAVPALARAEREPDAVNAVFKVR